MNAFQALDAMLLVGGDLACKWRPSIEIEVGDGGDDKPSALVFSLSSEMADDAAFIAHVVDAGDAAIGRQRNTNRPNSRPLPTRV